MTLYIHTNSKRTVNINEQLTENNHLKLAKNKETDFMKDINVFCCADSFKI